MAFPVQSPPLYPNVPPSSGVPAIFRSPAQAIPLGIVTVAADAVQVFRMFQAPQWGVYTKQGQIIAAADSVVSVDFRREARISDYPLEQGAFETYDKVQMPFDVRVRFAVSNSVDYPSLGSLGMSSQRKDFLAAIDRAFKSLDLYTVITPDATYPSVNITHYDYRRESKSGAALLVVDVWMEEVRVNAQAEYTKSSQPEGDPKQDAGNAQSTEGKKATQTISNQIGAPDSPPPVYSSDVPPPPADSGAGAGDFPPSPSPPPATAGQVGAPTPQAPPPVTTQDFGGAPAQVPTVNSPTPAAMSPAEQGIMMIN